MLDSLHPGAVSTSMGVDRDTGFARLVVKLLKSLFKSPEQGADTANYPAILDEVEGISGKYFYRRKAFPSSESSYDKHLARRLWD
jgi:hypothetical protein